MFGFGLGFDNI